VEVLARNFVNKEEAYEEW